MGKSCMIHVVFMLCSCAVQACSRVLLIGEVRDKFLDALRRPSLSALARRNIAKQISEKARKVSKCPYCEAVNGECSACDSHVICIWPSCDVHVTCI